MPDINKPASWKVSIALLPNYLTKIKNDLKGLLYVDTKRMSKKAELSERKSTANEPPPFYIPRGGPLNYFVDVSIVRDLDKEKEAIIKKCGSLEGYNLITPENYDTARFPPPHCIEVYAPSYKLELMFPFTLLLESSWGL